MQHDARGCEQDDKDDPHDGQVDPVRDGATHEAGPVGHASLPGRLARRQQAPGEHGAGPPDSSAHRVAEQVQHVEHPVRIGIQAEQAGELRRLNQQRGAESNCERRCEPPAQQAPCNEAERDEERDVRHHVRQGADAVFREVVQEAERIEPRLDAVGDAGAGSAVGQRIEREAPESQHVEHGEVGRYRRSRAQSPVPMVQVGEDGQREHHRCERPKRHRRREALAEPSEELRKVSHLLLLSPLSRARIPVWCSLLASALPVAYGALTSL